MEKPSFYCPHSIGGFTTLFRRMLDPSSPLVYEKEYLKNLGYSMQYLQYLDFTMCSKTQALHAVVYALTAKSIIICGMGVIESVLWYVVKSNGRQKTNDWMIIHEANSSHREGKSVRRIVTRLEQKLKIPEEVEMTLDAMLKITEARKLLGVEEQVYRDLNHLRKLRNRVHIHSVQHDGDSDWWKFTSKDVTTMKSALHSILTCTLFKPTSTTFELLAYLTPGFSHDD